MAKSELKDLWASVIKNSQWTPPPSPSPRNKVTRKLSFGTKLTLSGYVATVGFSLVCLIVFPFIRGTLDLGHFTINALSQVVFVSISSWAHIVPLLIYAEVWDRKLKPQDYKPSNRQNWLILGGATGIVLPGVYFWWVVFWEFWDYWFLDKENPDPVGMGQGIGIGAIIVMPPLIAIGVAIGLLIGKVSADFEAKAQNRTASYFLFISLFVLAIVLTSLMLIKYLY